MATLVRPKEQRYSQNNPFLQSTVPAPFPVELYDQQKEQDASLTIEVEEPQEEQSVAGPSNATLEEHVEAESAGVSSLELMPSIVHLERSCLMTLNNLLSVPNNWNPIVPDRRHSMPTTPQTAIHADLPDSSSALQTLVNNLRSRDSDSGNGMIQISSGSSDSELINELRMRVEGLSSTLSDEDSILAGKLVTLLSHFNRLMVIQGSVSSSHLNAQSNSFTPPDPTASLTAQAHPGELFHTLKRHLSDFQIERQFSADTLPPGSPPVLAVETALLWSRIDEEMENVVELCMERTERLSMNETYHPPEYDPQDYRDDFDDLDGLPEYDEKGRPSFDDSKSRISQRTGHYDGPRSPTLATTNEKMRLDLEAVTMAIDRLYIVAPQLHNQRVELKSAKVEEMANARALGKAKANEEKDVKELEKIVQLIGKASSRTLKDQSIILDEGHMKRRMEKIRLRDMAKREAFVEQLMSHSNAGRLSGQDAVLSQKEGRTKDPEALLTLPEFIREAVPPESIRQDPNALLSLPEFVNEPPPPRTHHNSSDIPTKDKGKGSIRHSLRRTRDRSLSAPALSWLRSKSSSMSLDLKASGSAKSSIESSRAESSSKTGFEVHYMAENHENLQHILVFLTVTGAVPGVDLEAEVLPALSSDENRNSVGERLIIKSGTLASLPLTLPGRVTPGKKDIHVQSGHYEIKLSTSNAINGSSNGPNGNPSEHTPLLDASQLTTINPTSFICASCSLPLIQGTKVRCYRDLPSEHWQELVDAWMCHTDAKLNEQVKHAAKAGFWPQEGEALVGGSYILFDEHAMGTNNLSNDVEKKADDNWSLVRCICGAVVGRSQEKQQNGSTSSTTVYRIVKYAIRPVSPTSEPFKIPLSAFIVEDMKEFVQAHASYRFVIQDEEEEKGRILIWLFKPSLNLAYATDTQYAIPKSGSMCVAKVLYKLLGPTEDTSDLKSILNKYPGFPQAEYLFYPMNICRRLAALLKESNRTYPEALRTLTGLEVGWLRRA